MFPFVLRRTYEQLRKDRLLWMQKAANNEREMFNAVRKLGALRDCLAEAQRIADGVPSESVLED